MTRLLGIALVLAGLGACCPIPLTRRVSERPELTVRVHDVEGRRVDAEVTVRRVTTGPPPSRETHRWSERTGSDGEVIWPAIEATETYAPLMMHGVEWYSWDVCAVAEAGAHSVRLPGRTPVVPPATVELTLEPDRTDCGWETLPETL